MTTTFDALGVSTDLVEALSSRGITAPFPIQELTIPDALAGRDVCGKAKTGSGKTLAFGLPIIERVGRAEPRRPKAIALVPTRELALQVHDELAPLAEQRDVRMLAIYGGANMERQIKTLAKGVDFVVATPGRMIDLIERKEVSVADLEIVVLDEADRMADMGFLPQVEWILRQADNRHQTLLFSATLDGVVDTLIKRYQHDPAMHEIESSLGHRRRDDAPVPADPPDGQGQGRGLDRPQLQPHHRVRAHQAGRRPPGRAAGQGGRAGRWPSTATCARPPGRRPWPTSRPASCPCWWPPTSPPGASTSTTSTWSSTTTRPRTTRPTCTARAAPPGPARRAWSSRSCCGTRSSRSSGS